MTAARPWAALLGFLDSEPAAAVEQMARRLHLLLGDDHRPTRGDGEPDGFGGIARRGDLERLLLSEWMIADEEPLEFLRRFTTGELAYLRREQRSPRSAERLVVLADTGADQVGVPRLVHLAALVVLYRRAEARGVPLALGVLTEPPGPLLEGDLSRLFTRWLAARSADRPTADGVRQWTALLGTEDNGWVFGAEAALDEAGPEVPNRLRRLTARESGWSSHGATRAEVRAGGRTVHLPLPPSRTSVRLLRGEGIRRTEGLVIERAEAGLRFPRFAGAGRRLLCRTNRPDELVAIPVAQSGPASGTPPRSRQLRFSGPVVAAGFVGKRTVALVLEGDRLRVSVVGKPLAGLEAVDIDAARVGLWLVDACVRGDLAPLLFHAGDVLVRLDGRWLTLSSGDLVWDRVGAAAPTTIPDQPVVLWRGGGSIHVRPRMTVSDAEHVMIGPRGLVAFGPAGGPYTILDSFGHHVTVKLEPGETVAGVTASPEGPLLVVRSGGDRIIRLRGPERARTLTAASGDIIDLTVHPTMPLLAVQRRSGVIEAFSLPDGRPVAIVLGAAE
jgi:hypothetical protein